MALFAERHYHEVRMDDVAARAGVAKGTLYLHFRNKEDLYVCLALEFMQKLIARTDCALGRESAPEAKLRSLIRTGADYIKDRRYMMEIFQRAELLAEPGQAEAFKLCKTRFFAVVESIIRELPGMTDSNEADRGLVVLSIMGGIREIIQRHAEPWPLDLHDRMTDLFLRMCKSDTVISV